VNVYREFLIGQLRMRYRIRILFVILLIAFVDLWREKICRFLKNKVIIK